MKQETIRVVKKYNLQNKNQNNVRKTTKTLNSGFDFNVKLMRKISEMVKN